MERPLDSPNGSLHFNPLCFDKPGPLVQSSERWTCSWARLFTQRLWTFGYHEQALASIFDALPSDFCATIQVASDRLQGLFASAAAHRRAESAAIMDSACGLDEPLCPGEDGAQAILECLEDIWERDGGEGFIEFAFDPTTQQRVNVILNSLTANIAGMHKEEVLARLAAHEAPISFLPLDYLCALLHQSLRAAVPSGAGSKRSHTDIIYLRMAQTGAARGRSHLIRMETIKLYGKGQVTQVRQAAIFFFHRLVVSQPGSIASPAR